MSKRPPGTAALISLLFVTLSGWVSPAQAESWMNERQRAASVQRDLGRLADQARQRNTPIGRMVVDPEAMCRALGKAACDGVDAARNGRLASEDQRQRELNEAQQRRDQGRVELERRFREIDAAAAGEADRLRARAMARVAAAQPFLSAGPQPGRVAQYCDAISVFSEEFRMAGAPNPALAVKSYQAAVTVDESQDNCWEGYARVSSMLMANDTVSSRFRYDFGPLGFKDVGNLEAGRRILAQYESWRAAMLRRKAVVETFVNPSARQPDTRPTQPPAKWADWAVLREATEPEARYWQSRVHIAGLLGQPQNLDAAQAAACDAKAASYFRNRLNCWSLKHRDPKSGGLAALVELMWSVNEERDPKAFQGKPALAEIMTRRSEAAAAAVMYGHQALSMAASVAAGEMPTDSGQPRALAAEQLQRMACSQFEAAVALGYYDNNRVAFNLVSCYENEHARAPEGARSKLFRALETDGNPAYKRWLESQLVATNTVAPTATVPASSSSPR